MRLKIHRTVLFQAVLLMLVICLTGILPAKQVRASVTSEESAKTYLNVTCKYLYLGITDKSKFDFNINEDAMQQGATYQWSIIQDKGQPYAVKINEETGLVTAKRAGTAYIKCDITLPGHTVISPEAQVIVRNNITAVEISNIPENNMVFVGKQMDFNEIILNTAAGAGVYTNGITRWEIADDSAGIGDATDDGIVTPKITGKFNIRAVCFENMQDYNMWLKNKAANANRITAASNWVTLSAVQTEGTAYTQGELVALLTDKRITLIKVSEIIGLNLTIPAGDYSDKTLEISNSDINVTNYGLFKQINIAAATNMDWMEYAANNNFKIYDTDIDITLTDKAHIKSIEINTNNDKPVDNSTEIRLNTVNIAGSGEIDNLDINTACRVVVSGNLKVNQFTIHETADGSKIAANVADINVYADCVITLIMGPSRFNVNIPNNIDVTVENLSSVTANINYYYNLAYESLPTYRAVHIRDGHSESMGKVTTSSVIKVRPVSDTEVIASAVKSGVTVWNSVLIGSFSHNAVLITGTFRWVNPEKIVNQSGYYQWEFIPEDTDHFDTVTGWVRVDIIN